MGVIKMRKRTIEEFHKVLYLLLDTYDTNRDILKMDATKAKEKVLRQYDDFNEWVYFEGDFFDDNQLIVNEKVKK
jgi:hypothetical protein